MVLVETDEDLIRVVTNYAWSPNIYKTARLKDDFISTDFLVLDIDEELRIEEAEEIVAGAGITCLCLPSTSHSEENHRFRMIFPLSKTITTREVYVASMMDLVESFPQADLSCVTDFARYYFGCRQDDGFWFEGELLEPTKPPQRLINAPMKRFNHLDRVPVGGDIKELISELYKSDREDIPEAVDFFIRNANTGLKGEWNHALNAFVFTLGLQDIDYQTVYDITEYLAPEPLDSKDIGTVKRAWQQGNESRERE